MKNILKKILPAFMDIAIILLLLMIFSIVSFYIYYQINYKKFVNDILDNMSYSDFVLENNQTVYFSNGKEMILYSPYQKEVISNSSEITEVIRKTVLAAEDERFYKHHGIDTRSIIRAAISNLTSNNTQGASTITQQLVKLTYLSNEKTYDRKIKEIFISLAVEKRMSKDEILLAYLNRVYFYNGIYGIADASEFYFGKSYKNLTYDEAASLIAIINSPTRLDPINNYESNQLRKDRILTNLNRIYDLDLIVGTNTQFSINDSGNDKYVYDKNTTGAITYVLNDIKENSLENNKEIYTTIDYDLQVYIESLIDELNDPLQAAITIIDNNTGKVIAIDGSKSSEDEGSISALNRAFQSPRQSGSSIKPLLDYGVIFDNYDIDTDFEVYDTGGNNIPKNSNGKHLGKITIKKAVTNSVNTIAFRLYSFMKDDGITPLSYLEEMNFSHLDEKDYDALAVSIGGFTYGVTSLEMASGYAALANNGIYIAPTAIVDLKTERKQVYSPIAAYLTTDALSEVATKGTAKKLNPDIPLSCKTGTTNNNKDAWLCGYTRDYTIAIWVGADNYNEDYSVKSSGEVLNMFKSILDYLEPVDEEIYTEEEISNILSYNNHPRKNPEKLKEYFEDLIPYTPPVVVQDDTPQEVPQEPVITVVPETTPPVENNIN